MAAPYNLYTDFPNGVTSFGVPLFGGNGGIVTASFGKTWFVNARSGIGSDGFSGQSPTSPFLTMTKAFSVIASGDVINFVGKVTEQLVTPVNVFDVTVNGCGKRPRHADATPVGGNYAAAQWAPPTSGAVSGQATVRVIQQGWIFNNILFTMESATAAGVEIVRNAAAGDLERDGSHAQILNCRFAGAGIGIRSDNTGFTEKPFNVLVAGNTFNGNTTCMSDAIGTNGWQIIDNVFTGTSIITMKLESSFVARNVVGAFTAAGSSGGIDLNGGVGLNQVCLNNLSGTYSIAGGYRVANANDNWYGNASSAGFTSADPA
jgi:hypothetical protein